MLSRRCRDSWVKGAPGTVLCDSLDPTLLCLSGLPSGRFMETTWLKLSQNYHSLSLDCLEDLMSLDGSHRSQENFIFPEGPIKSLLLHH